MKPNMTRKEIESQYEVKDGRIVSPGKFEGEMVYVPYFWDVFLNGCADRDNGTVLGFDVDENDKREFPELRRRRTVKILEDNNGFVCEV